MLFSLETVLKALLVHVMCTSFVCAETHIDVKKLLESAHEAARKEKQTIDQLVRQSQTKISQIAINEKGAIEPKGCAVGGCAGLQDTSSASPSRQSPLLDAKRPLIFVSASMPLESLKRLAYQAVQRGAILVIRGMVKGSMMETAHLVDQIDHPLEIDPKLFERFGVKRVPVFLIPHNDTWHTVSGNVDLEFALETVNNDRVGHTQQKENKR